MLLENARGLTAVGIESGTFTIEHGPFQPNHTLCQFECPLELGGIVQNHIIIGAAIPDSINAILLSSQYLCLAVSAGLDLYLPP